MLPYEGSLPIGKSLSIPRGHLPAGKFAYTDSMANEVGKIRHLRYLELLRTTKAVDLAERLGVEANYLSRVKKGPGKKGGKAIGEDSAREWEKLLDLPRYWFDGAPEASGVREPTSLYHGVRLTRAGALFAEEWEKMDLADRIEVEADVLQRVAKKVREQRKRPRPPSHTDD